MTDVADFRDEKISVYATDRFAIITLFNLGKYAYSVVLHKKPKSEFYDFMTCNKFDHSLCVDVRLRLKDYPWIQIKNSKLTQLDIKINSVLLALMHV